MVLNKNETLVKTNSDKAKFGQNLFISGLSSAFQVLLECAGLYEPLLVLSSSNQGLEIPYLLLLILSGPVGVRRAVPVSCLFPTRG